MIDKDIFNKNVDFNGVKGLLLINGKAVVFKRDNNTDNFPLLFDLPGGGREIGESPFETLEREIKEEFNLDIKEEEIEYAKKYPSVLNKDQFAYFIVINFSNKKEGNIIFGNEGLYYSLITPKEFIGLPYAVKPQQERVRDYLNSIS